MRPQRLQRCFVRCCLLIPFHYSSVLLADCCPLPRRRLVQSWPSAIRTVFGDQERYETNYFAPFQVGVGGRPGAAGLRVDIDAAFSLPCAALAPA